MDNWLNKTFYLQALAVRVRPVEGIRREEGGGTHSPEDAETQNYPALDLNLKLPRPRTQPKLPRPSTQPKLPRPSTQPQTIPPKNST